MGKKPTQPQPKQTDSQTQPAETFSVPLLILTIFLAIVATSMGTYYVMTHKDFVHNLFSLVQPASISNVTPTLTTLPQTPVIPEDWLTYTNPEVGIQVQYPPTVSFNADTKGAAQSSLRISVDLIEILPEEMTLGMDRKSAMADKAALEKGQAKTVGDFAASDALVRIGGTYNGRMTSVLSRFEVCSVLFERTLVFYPGEYRVIVSLDGPKDDIVASMPEFFTTDPANCGDQLVWNRDKMGEFMPTLAKGEGKGAAKEWYDTFNQIIQTITFVPLGTPIISPLPQGCEISDNAFCNVLSDIKNSMTNGNYAGFLAYQTPTSITCDPEGLAMAACEGMAKGVVKEGYMIGYPESEGSLVNRSEYAAAITNFVGGESFSYHGSVVGGEKGISVFVNSSKTKMVAFPLKKTGATWRMNVTLLGNLHLGSEYISLPQSLLEAF